MPSLQDARPCALLPRMDASRAKARPRLSRFYERHFRKRPQQSRSRSVVDSLLSAALEKLTQAKDGNAVSLQDVAVRAGVGIGSLYDYFRDKDGLLAGVVAKVTEDNLDAFEGVLAAAERLPLGEAVGSIVDFAIETYLADPRIPRNVLRVAHGLGLMPMLMASQELFAQSLARALGRRDDVHVADVEAAAYVATQTLWGVIHALLWEDKERTPSRDRARDACVAMLTLYLGGVATGSEP